MIVTAGNPAAPNLNELASRFGRATSYFGVTHPSEPNYVAVLGGNSFGIADDNPYYMNSVTKPGRQRFRHLMSGPSASSRDRAASSRRWWSTGTAPDGPSYPARTQAAPGTTSTA